MRKLILATTFALSFVFSLGQSTALAAPASPQAIDVNGYANFGSILGGGISGPAALAGSISNGDLGQLRGSANFPLRDEKLSVAPTTSIAVTGRVPVRRVEPLPRVRPILRLPLRVRHLDLRAHVCKRTRRHPSRLAEGQRHALVRDQLDVRRRVPTPGRVLVRTDRVLAAPGRGPELAGCREPRHVRARTDDPLIEPSQ